MGFKDFIFEYLQLRKLNKLDPSEKNLIFYSESENQWDFYEEIILQLIKKKINICYVTSSKKEYLRSNLLKVQVNAKDVAKAFIFQAKLSKTTGNIITVDGGNIEASLR